MSYEKELDAERQRLEFVARYDFEVGRLEAFINYIQKIEDETTTPLQIFRFECDESTAGFLKESLKGYAVWFGKNAKVAKVVSCYLDMFTNRHCNNVLEYYVDLVVAMSAALAESATVNDRPSLTELFELMLSEPHWEVSVPFSETFPAEWLSFENGEEEFHMANRSLADTDIWTFRRLKKKLSSAYYSQYCTTLFGIIRRRPGYWG
jgi:hypothetical protein